MSTVGIGSWGASYQGMSVSFYYVSFEFILTQPFVCSPRLSSSSMCSSITPSLQTSPFAQHRRLLLPHLYSFSQASSKAERARRGLDGMDRQLASKACDLVLPARLGPSDRQTLEDGGTAGVGLEESKVSPYNTPCREVRADIHSVCSQCLFWLTCSSLPLTSHSASIDDASSLRTWPIHPLVHRRSPSRGPTVVSTVWKVSWRARLAIY